MLSLTGIFIFLSSGLFGGLAGPKIKNEPGSKSDLDFSLMIPITLMQILSLAISGLQSLWERPEKHHVPSWPKVLIWFFVVATLVSAIFAPVVYCSKSQLGGQIMSFLASCGQAVMVVQLTMFVDLEWTSIV